MFVSKRRKLENFPKLSNTTNDYKRLDDLYDFLCEIQCAKDNPHYSQVLAYFDSSTGVNQIVCVQIFLNPPIGSAELAALMLSAWRAESGPSHLIKRSNSSAGVTLSSPITALNVCFQDRY
jgi:hypothetical protein